MRLLVATEFPPDAPGGGPAVVRQMLRNFPGKVDWWSVRRSFLTPSGSADGWRGDGFIVDRHFHAFPGLLYPQRRWTKMRGLFMELGWSVFAEASLRSALAQAGADQAWLLPHEWAIFPLYRVFKRKRRQCPRVPAHVTVQDFPDSQQRQALLGQRMTHKMALAQEALYQLADTCDATSSSMLEELQHRTGRLGQQMLHAGLEQEDFNFLAQSLSKPILGTPIRIAYAGTIVVEDEFQAFVRILSRLRPLLSIGLELCFWSAHSYRSRSWFDPVWMREFGHLPESELRMALRTADWGFIPMSIKDDDPRYNRFSFPTKFITYLAAGLPVISLGHPESSLMQLTHPYRLGIRLVSREELETKLTPDLLQARGTKESCRSELLRCARDWFDARKTRRRLWKAWGCPSR